MEVFAPDRYCIFIYTFNDNTQCPMLILDYKWKCTTMFYLNILLHSLYVCECTMVA